MTSVRGVMDIGAGDWAGKGITGLIVGALSIGATVFATRKTAEAAMMDRVNARIDQAFKRQDVQIAQAIAGHEACEAKLREAEANNKRECAELRRHIERLMGGPIANYGEDA